MKEKEARRELTRPMAQTPPWIIVATLEIRAMEVTDNNIGDALVLPELLN